MIQFLLLLLLFQMNQNVLLLLRYPVMSLLLVCEQILLVMFIIGCLCSS